MPQTSIVNNSRTECNNGECVQITTSCIDGECTERRIVVDEQTMPNNFEGDTGQENTGQENTGQENDGDYFDDDTSSEGSSDNGCEDYKKRTIAIIFSGIDVTIPSFILSLCMLTILMVGLFKMKKK